MAYNKLHKKDFSIAVKTGNANGDQSKFAKEASKGELFFNNYDKKLYMATTTAGGTDAVLYNTNAFSLTPAPYSNNYALDFDGSNDYVVGSASALTVGTVSCWFYNDVVISASTATGQVVFSQGGSDFGIVLGSQTALTNEIISIQYGGGAFGYTSTTDSISVGWHHVMLAWVSSSSTNPGNAGYDIWLDGVKVGNASTSPPSAPDTLSTSFYLGARGGTYRFFNGKIDEFALWTGDVSGDIGNIYDSSNPGAVDLSDTNIVGTLPNVWWRCGDNDGGSPTTITDQGSAGFDGTINGATPVLDTP